MSNNRRSAADVPEWFAWLYRHGVAAFAAASLFLMAVFAVGAYWLDRRLEGLEEEFSRQPPKSYQAPDLSKYPTPQLAPDQVLGEESIYLPIYSHAYFGGGRPFLLEAMVSIRNTSVDSPTYVKSVRYYDTVGELVREPLDRTIALGPLETIEFLVPQRDSRGGSGANMIIAWVRTPTSTAPLVEAVMVGNAGTHGICFSSRGEPLAAPDSLPGGKE